MPQVMKREPRAKIITIYQPGHIMSRLTRGTRRRNCPLGPPSIARSSFRHAATASRAWLLRAAVLVFIVSVAPSPALADVLVSTFSQGQDSTRRADSNRASLQPFTTGSNTGGYTLTSVQLKSEDPEGDAYYVALCPFSAGGWVPPTEAELMAIWNSGNSLAFGSLVNFRNGISDYGRQQEHWNVLNGIPNFWGQPVTDSCTMLTSPTDFTAGTHTFTASANLTLTANTTYFLLIHAEEKENGDDTVIFDTTYSDDEDAGAAAGWGVADEYLFITTWGADAPWKPTASGMVHRININGTTVSNAPATGAPTITGTAQVGETLTASTSDIDDPNGLTSPTYSYQWIWVDGLDETDITGETSSTYTLTADDEGKQIKVRVTFQDDDGNDEELTSVAYLPTTNALTGEFRHVPKSHNSPFTFEVHFSEEVPLSYVTLRDAAFTVTNGEVTRARRLNPPSNLGWEITVDSFSEEAVTMVLPETTDCTAAGAICTEDGRPLSAKLSATVAGPPDFRARFADLPAAHDGTNAIAFKVRFNQKPKAGYSYKTMRDDTLVVRQGGEAVAITRARRLNKPHNDQWEITVIPVSKATMTVAIRQTASCSETGAVCTADDEVLANGGLSRTIPGPPGLLVTDAEVREAAGATVDFPVILSPAASSAVTVAYATTDGTATAGADYTQTAGTLTFEPGETLKTISVPVLDDVLDDDGETFTLTLSNPSGGNAYLVDATATGTIRNSDPLPRAWLARFGRTVGTHVTDAVGDRLRATPGPGSHVTIGGYRLPLGNAGRDAGRKPGPDAEVSASALLQGLAGVLGLGGAPAGGSGDTAALTGRGPGWDPWLDGPDPRLGQSQTLNLDLRQVLLGSSFRLNVNAAQAGGGPRLTAWGRFAGTRFAGQDGTLSLDGDVLTGTVGVDGEWDRVLAGVAVAHSRGDGGYRSPDDTGELENTLTSLHPYLRYAVTDRLNVWGMLGYGWGELELEQGTGAAFETDTHLVMGSFGGRGILLAADETGGFQLATRTDAMLTRTTSDAVTGLQSSEADAHRVRLVLEGTRGVTWADGRSLTPTVELGLRHDWGDAETGFGLEVGGRVRYADPGLGLTVEATVRGLLAHEDSDYEEWGASGTVRVAPGPAGHGLSLTLSPTWGAAASGVNGLWSRQTTTGLAPQSRTQASTGQLAAEVGYGLPAPVGTGLLTPYAGTVLAEGAARTYRVGTRWTGAKGLTLHLEGRRQEPAGQQPVNQGLRLQATWSF